MAEWIQTVLALAAVGGALAWLGWQGWLKVAGKKGCACSGCGRGDMEGVSSAGRRGLVQLGGGKAPQGNGKAAGR